MSIAQSVVIWLQIQGSQFESQLGHITFMEIYHEIISTVILPMIQEAHIEGWVQDYSNSNIFLKPLFRGNLDPFVNNANLGAIARTSNGT